LKRKFIPKIEKNEAKTLQKKGSSVLFPIAIVATLIAILAKQANNFTSVAFNSFPIYSFPIYLL
jgi:hypothetical protein